MTSKRERSIKKLTRRTGVMTRGSYLPSMTFVLDPIDSLPSNLSLVVDSSSITNEALSRCCI